MLSEKMQKALNEQLTYELYSGYVYNAMAAWLKREGLDGFSGWMEANADEERVHARKFYDFLYDRLSYVEYGQIDRPKAEYESPLAAIEAALAHEQEVTRRINELVKLSREENDYATEAFLQWFVIEQVEEEMKVDEVLQQMRLAGDFRPGLFFMDRELAGKVAAAPAEGE